MRFVEDRRPFTAYFGDVVQFGDLTGLANIDAPDQNVLGGRATSTMYEMTFESDLFPGLAHGAQVTISSGRYIGNYGVIKVTRHDDGAFSVATLQRM